MTQEHLGEQDPRLENPNEYFGEKYGDALVKYGGFPRMPLSVLIQEETKVRGDDVNKNPKKRAKVIIDMLKESEDLEPEDDITIEGDE